MFESQRKNDQVDEEDQGVKRKVSAFKFGIPAYNLSTIEKKEP